MWYFNKVWCLMYPGMTRVFMGSETPLTMKLGQNKDGTKEYLHSRMKKYLHSGLKVFFHTNSHFKWEILYSSRKLNVVCPFGEIVTISVQFMYNKTCHMLTLHCTQLKMCPCVRDFNYYCPHPKDDGRLYFQSVHICRGGGCTPPQVWVGGDTPSQVWVGGTPSQV